METKSDANAVAGLLRQIPSVDELLGRESLRRLEAELGHRVVVEAARTILQSVREGITNGTIKEFAPAKLDEQIAAAAGNLAAYSLQPVINATGVILHTNLGRAPLASKAVEHLGEIAGGYSNLEYDLERRKARKARYAHRPAFCGAGGRRADPGGEQQRRRRVPHLERARGGRRSGGFARRTD